MTALSEEIPKWQIFMNQLGVLTSANLKTRYRKTIAGFLWVIISPLISFAVQLQIFTRVIKIGVPNYSLFLLSGLLPWIFINQSLEMCTPLLQNSAAMLKSFPTHPLVYLMAQITDNLINFAAAFAIIFIWTLSQNHEGIFGLLLLPIPVLLMVVAVIGGAWFLSSLQIFFRDTRYILTFVLGVSFFLTPVFYPVDAIPFDYQWLVNWNPFYVLIAPFRPCLYEFNSALFFNTCGRALILNILIWTLAVKYWEKKRSVIYLDL